MIRILFTIIAVFAVIAIARESTVWSIIVGALLFCILFWLNKEPSKKPTYNKSDTSAREQQELINRHEYES